MKKNLLKALCSIALSALLFSGCKKVTEEEFKQNNPATGNEELNPGTANTQEGDNNCRLRAYTTSYGYQELFSYNRKDLASRWYIDNGDGTFYDYYINYDRKDRLFSSRELIPGDAVDINFYTDGKHITRASGYFESTGGLYIDIFYIFNNKGQMIRLDDVVNDIHCRFSYDSKGFNRRSDFYIGTELFYTFFINYDIPNKNPYLALNGIDFGFPFYVFNVTLFDKRWNSSGRVVIYDNGDPIVIAEDDPAKTVMHTGNGNYLTYAKYFDIPSESYYDMTFAYSNCNGHANEENSELLPAPSVKKSGPMPVMARLNKMLQTPSRNMKQQLIDFRRQCLDQLKAKSHR